MRSLIEEMLKDSSGKYTTLKGAFASAMRETRRLFEEKGKQSQNELKEISDLGHKIISVLEGEKE